MPPYDSSAARQHLAAELRTLGILRLDGENILAGVRPNISLDQLTDGRLERLLALVDRAVTQHPPTLRALVIQRVISAPVLLWPGAEDTSARYGTCNSALASDRRTG